MRRLKEFEDEGAVIRAGKGGKNFRVTAYRGWELDPPLDFSTRGLVREEADPLDPASKPRPRSSFDDHQLASVDVMEVVEQEAMRQARAIEAKHRLPKKGRYKGR